MSEGGIVFIVITGFLFGFIIISAFCYRTNHKCPKCKKITLFEINSKETGKSYSTKKVKEEIKDKTGQVVGTVEREIPTTTIEYICTYKCSNCGYSELRNKSNTINGVK